MGERIKTRRKELGMTAEELGDAIGRSRATIYKYEKGDIENLSHTLLIPLAEALHTTPEYLLGYDDAPDDPEEWLNDSGHILPDNTVRNVANKAQEDAGLPHSRLHDLRHAHASVLLENMNGEGDILKVSRRLGHSSVATTMNIYAHVLNKSEDDVVNVLDSLF